MKLSPRALQIFWDLHAWVGVVASLLLYVMFLAGGVSLFRRPIELWQEPGLHRSSTLAMPSVQDRASGVFAASGGAPEDFWLLFEPGMPTLDRIYSNDETVYLAGRDGTPLPERERLGEFLYQVHYLHHEAAPWLEYVAAILGVLMLVAVVTGVLIHLHNLVRQFHQFRVDKGRRVIWSDLHKVLGVTGLPFQLLYAFTGALILLGPILVDVQASRSDARSAEVRELARLGKEDPPAPSGEPSPVLSLDALLDIARREIEGLSVEIAVVRGHGKSDGFIVVRGPTDRAPLSTSAIWIRERDGHVLQRAEAATSSPYAKSSSWLSGVHYAHYCGWLIKIFLALLAIATSITIVSGNVLWLARRRDKGDTLSYRLLERLTVGAGGGAPIAIGACFVASRVVSLSWSGHHGAEEAAFFATLLLAVAASLIVSREHLGSLWWKQLALAGALFVSTPLLARRWSTSGLFGHVSEWIGTVVAVDAGLLVTGLALLFMAHRLRRTRQAEDG